MSTTFGALKTRVATVLQDPTNKTFTEAMVEELILAGLVEVGGLSPEQFTEDLTLVAGEREYAVRSTTFSGAAVPEIELMRVEVWDPTQTPEALIHVVPEAGLENTPADSGWSMWGGTLQLPGRTIKGVEGNESVYVLRVYGYSPYLLPTAGDDAAVIATSKDNEQAVLAYTRLEALQQLIASRELFTQWQTRSGNSDTTFAGMMNMLNVARDEWRRKSRAITRLRARA